MSERIKNLAEQAALAAIVSGITVGIMHYRGPEARERRAIAALCDEGAAVYLRCAGGDCRAAAPGAGIVDVKPGLLYRHPLEEVGATLSWQLTRTSTKTGTTTAAR